MKISIILGLITLVSLISQVDHYQIGRLVIENIPRNPTPLVERLGRYENVRGAAIRDWLPDNKGILITTRFAESYQLFSVEMPLGMRRQLTFFQEPVADGLVCPDSSQPYFLFTRDSAGNEVDQIFSFNLRTGEWRMLTDGRALYRTVSWSHKGDRFAFSSNKRNGRDFDIYIGTLAGLKSFKPILEQDGFWYVVDWSGDDERLLVEEYVSANETHYYSLEIKTGRLTMINPTDQKIYYGSGRWKPDGSGVYLVSDQFDEFRQLLYYDLKDKDFEVISKGIPWDIEDFEISPDGTVIAFTSNEDGYNRLYFFDIQQGKITQARLPDGLVYNLKFKPDGRELALVINTPRAPSDVYILNLEKHTLIRWTSSEIAGLDTTQFIEPRLIHYPTFDSIDGRPRMIPALYHRPDKGRPPYPVLIDCHGGPEGQAVPVFSTLNQFLLNEMGIAVIEPNVRGSSGYGKTFLALDNGYQREGAVRDIGALLDWIAQQPELDDRRIGITGGSYGGYMVLAAMFHFGDRLRCGIDLWGISDFVTFLENTGLYRQELRRNEYGDEQDPRMHDFLKAISPLTNAHKIKKPIFIVQGLNDPRVPVSEAEQIKEAIRKNKVDVWYLLAEDEGHGFGKKSNRDFYRQALIEFLEKYLLK